MKLIAALVCAALTCGVVFAATTRKPQSPPPLTALELCRAGGVELIDERCNAEGCAKQSVRLTWDRGEGALYEGDIAGEREQRRIRAGELDRLLESLAALTPTSSDSDLVCGSFGCPPTDRALTITTDCGSGRGTFTFMRARPAWERVRSDCVRYEGAELAKCTAERTWHAAFATSLAPRFGAVFERLRESARGG